MDLLVQDQIVWIWKLPNTLTACNQQKTYVPSMNDTKTHLSYSKAEF